MKRKLVTIMNKVRKQLFKKLRKEKYTILCPDMLPIHFEMLTKIVADMGYNIVLVSPKGRAAKDEGLRAIHNDACYPALIVAGQFISELKSGKYDLNKTAVIMSQTGGGCRASNYISLFKKAFNEQFPTVPVLSLNFSGLEKDNSFPLTIKFIVRAITAIQYGDLLMTLVNQCEPYEKEKGQIQKVLKETLDKIVAQIGHRSFFKLKKNLKMILDTFLPYMPGKERKPQVAVVGEIYVKYSPYANNHLTEYLLEQGCEPVYPSLSEFLLYCIFNIINDYHLYGYGRFTAKVAKIIYRYYLKKTRQMNKMLEGTNFFPYEDFEYVVSQGKRVISLGVKMGEGWLISAEMLAYSEHNIKNIVCAQPFGCLPNHIVGKGMVRPLKQLSPDINIVPLDFDASSTQVNQENRLKLMLANMKQNNIEK